MLTLLRAGEAANEPVVVVPAWEPGWAVDVYRRNREIVDAWPQEKRRAAGLALRIEGTRDGEEE